MHGFTALWCPAVAIELTRVGDSPVMSPATPLTLLAVECWLKKANLDEIHENVLGKNHSGIPWTGGLVYSEEESRRLMSVREGRLQKEAARKKALRDDESLPLIFMDVSLDGKVIMIRRIWGSGTTESLPLAPSS